MKHYDLTPQIYSEYRNIGFPDSKIKNGYSNSNANYLHSINSSTKVGNNNSQYFYYTNPNLTTYQDTNSTTSSINYTGVNTNLSSVNSASSYYSNLDSITSNISNLIYNYVPVKNSNYFPNQISYLNNALNKNNQHISSLNSLQQASLLGIRGTNNNIGLANSPNNVTYINAQSPQIVNAPLPVASAGYYIQGQNVQSMPYIESGINYQNIYNNNHAQNFNGKTSYYNYAQNNQISRVKYDLKSYELDDDELNTSKELNEDDLNQPEPLDSNPNMHVSNNYIYQYGSQNINPTTQVVRLPPSNSFYNLNYVQNHNQAVLLPNYSSVNSQTSQSIYVQNQNIQPPKIAILPPRLIRTGVPNILGSPVRMTIRCFSEPANLRSSYLINASNHNQSIRVPFSPIRYSITRPQVLSPMRYSISRPVLLSPVRNYNFTSLPLVSIPINKYNFSSVSIMSNPIMGYSIASNSPMNSPSRKFYITSVSKLSDPIKKYNYTSTSIASSPQKQNRASSPHDAIRSPLRENQFSSPKIITSSLRQNRFLSPQDTTSHLRQNRFYSPPIITSPLRQSNTNQIYNITSPFRQSGEIEIARIVSPIRKNNIYKLKTYKVSSLKNN